jgi:RNA polymerase sigma-70 factor (ECF subfamily)
MLKSEYDEGLVKGYIEGQPAAYQEVSGWIQRAVDSRHWGLSHQREDIRQEVHQRLFRNLSQGHFRGSSSLRTYVVQITKFTCIEFLRRKIRDRSVDLDSVDLHDPTPSPEQRLAAVEKEERVAEAFATLPDGCRQLFEMIFERRLPYQEISRNLGVAEGTVKSRAWRCRELLMRALGTKGAPREP